MVYDDTSKKWVPIKPGQQGFSRINMYHNTVSNTFRVVGVKLQDQQVRAGDQLYTCTCAHTHMCAHTEKRSEKNKVLIWSPKIWILILTPYSHTPRYDTLSKLSFLNFIFHICLTETRVHTSLSYCQIRINLYDVKCLWKIYCTNMLVVFYAYVSVSNMAMTVFGSSTP